MGLRESLLVLAVVVALGALGLVLGREPEGLARPEPERPAARSQSPHAPRSTAPLASGAFRPRGDLRLTPAGLVDTDPHVPVERYGSAIDEYWGEIRSGDSRHAYELASLLIECKLARDFIGGAKDEDVRSTLAARVRQCEGASPDIMDHRQQLLELAASRGDVRAQSRFGLVPPERLAGAADPRAPEIRAWEAKAIGYWQAAAEQGSAGAMSMLAGSYRQGDWGVERDPATALAYYLSVTALAPRWGSESARRDYEARVNYEQRERAFELHRELMARCCEAAP